MLDGGDAPGGEAAPVANALDVVDDGPRRVRPPQEVAVQRLGEAIGRHRAPASTRASPHLSAAYALPALLRAAAAKHVLLRGSGSRMDRSHVERAAETWRWRTLRTSLAMTAPRRWWWDTRTGRHNHTVNGWRNGMSSTERHDVVIAGGGTAGLALACALADALGDGARIALPTAHNSTPLPIVTMHAPSRSPPAPSACSPCWACGRRLPSTLSR